MPTKKKRKKIVTFIWIAPTEIIFLSCLFFLFFSWCRKQRDYHVRMSAGPVHPPPVSAVDTTQAPRRRTESPVCLKLRGLKRGRGYSILSVLSSPPLRTTLASKSRFTLQRCSLAFHTSSLNRIANDARFVCVCMWVGGWVGVGGLSQFFFLNNTCTSHSA